MQPDYPIVVVDPAAWLWDEPMGTKEKFWYEAGGFKHLFKKARTGTGEDWAEKAAQEIARCLGLPAADVELATCKSDPGTCSRSFLEADEVLVHGNELLHEGDVSYPTTQLRGVSKHTVAAVLRSLQPIAPPRRAAESALRSGADWFVGYLLLDALIGNVDRHHENWGVIQCAGRTMLLAPSYDHASSLGREMSDRERSERLGTRDQRRTVRAYGERARSALYRSQGDAHPLHPLHAFTEASRFLPQAAAFWRARLVDTSAAALAAVLDRLPGSRMTPAACNFARALLSLNRGELEKAVIHG
jgi:hypothetical protein